MRNNFRKEMHMKNSKPFSWIQFLKTVAVIAVPVALQNLLTTTGSMVDTMMLAPLGERSVAAVGLCAQFSSLMFAGYWGFVGGGMLFFSQYWGAKDHDGVNRSYGITLVCMGIVAFLFTCAAVLLPETVMRIYTDKAPIREVAVKYLRIVGFAYPLQVYSMAMSALLRSTEKVRIPMYGALASVSTNIVLNWIFIYGKLGLPAMGIQGAALATVCAGLVNVVTILVLGRRQKHPYLFSLTRHFRWTRAQVAIYLRKCFPILCNEVLIGVGNMVINMVLGRQIEQAIAATAVFRTLEGLVIGFFAGFSNASAVLVGKAVGAGELDEAYGTARRLVYLCGGFIFLVCLTLVLAHKPILTVMSLSGTSLEIGTGMLMIYCVAAVIRMMNWTQNDTFRAAGDATTGTVLEIAFMYAMLLPCVCLTGLKWHSPFLLIFACCYIDEPIRFVIMQLRLHSGKWIRPVTPQGQQALPDFLLRRGHKPKSIRK